MKNNNSFATIKSKNELFEIRVGRPKDTKVNLFFNFNIRHHLDLLKAIETLPYLTGKGVQDYDDILSGMAVELIHNNSLVKLIEDLPELLYMYVETKKAKYENNN